MVPWIMGLAGLLAAKQGSGAQKKQLAGELMSRNAQRLGGNTDVLDATVGRNAIEAQEGQAIGGALANSLVGHFSDKAAAAAPKAAPAPAVAAPAPPGQFKVPQNLLDYRAAEAQRLLGQAPAAGAVAQGLPQGLPQSAADPIAARTNDVTASALAEINAANQLTPEQRQLQLAGAGRRLRR